jgi:hypothetical protein
MGIDEDSTEIVNNLYFFNNCFISSYSIFFNVVDIPLTRREFLKLLGSGAATVFALSTFGFNSIIFDNPKMQNNNNNSGGRARANNHRSGGRLQ